MFDRLLQLIKKAMPDANVDGATVNSRLVEDLGLDSIGIMMLAMSLEDEFGVHFSDAINFVIVQDVIDFLEANATK